MLEMALLWITAPPLPLLPYEYTEDFALFARQFRYAQKAG